MFKKLIVIGIFIAGCTTPSYPVDVRLEEAKRIDKRMKSDWKDEYVYICDTYGGKKVCGYEHRRDVERRLRMMRGGI